MDTKTARRLNDLNTRFYSRVHDSFSATRQAPWPGWKRVRNATLEAGAIDNEHRFHVLDLACGNLRFERYLASCNMCFEAWCADNCPELAPTDKPAYARLQNLDVVEALLCEEDLARTIDAPSCDLCVCFGFMHHLAMPEHRKLVLHALLSKARPGGVVAVSFWRFAKSPRIMAKAKRLEDPGDYLLGWQDEAEARRYCHSFSEGEIDELAASTEKTAREIDRFSADGRSGDLNRYLVLQRL